MLIFLLSTSLTGSAVDMGGLWSSHLLVLHCGVGGQLILLYDYHAVLSLRLHYHRL